MQKFGSWFTVDLFDIELWGRIYEIQLWAVCKGEGQGIIKEQEQACSDFLANLKDNQKNIERTIEEFFHISDAEKLRNTIKLKSASFSRDGKYGMALSTTLEDEYIEECGIGPDDNFGISLFPRLFILTSDEDYMDFLGY